LTETVAALALDWQVQRPQQELEVRFTGATVQTMQQWLGEGALYGDQGSGDLGQRMAIALQQALEAGARRVVLIGSDCPFLTPTLLDQAFEALQHHDLVLGPALDGGYYLIGLRYPCPDLFQSVDWGTERVLDQTRAIAQRLNLRWQELTPLRDLDRPEDLPYWVPPGALSVVVPVLNEAAALNQTLALPLAQGIETIVVDGGSQDDSRAIAQALGATVLQSEPGRALQMNRGAAIAQGSILVFLHGDTQLPPGFSVAVRRVLSQPRTVAGAFRLGIAGTHAQLRWIEWGTNWRSRCLQLPYGDQALFLERKRFEVLGGFPEWPLLEDYVLVRRLQRQGQIGLADLPVQTSARRWQRLGLVRTTLLNQGILLGYHLGVPVAQLARWYGRKPSSRVQTANETVVTQR
jgi:rSAM/selenodomain-associated transferase 2/rSAM/selenodomain-associated transferase 1